MKNGYYIYKLRKHSRTSKPHILIVKLTNKSDLRIGKKVIALSNLSIYYTWKNIKSSYNNNKFKTSAPTWNDESELHLKMDLILYQIFRIILTIFKKKHGEDIDKPSVQVYVNKNMGIVLNF